MRAYVLKDHGTSPELGEVATPVPGPGQILIEVAACGLNFADLLMVNGTYQDTPALPFTPGLEVAGIVRDAGTGAGVVPGTRVAAYLGHGGLAEYAVCDATRCVAIPDAMPMAEAAGFLIAYGTSHLALTGPARLKRGQRLVVLGAAGGVGLTAVEIGAALGAEVVAVARGAEKLSVAKHAGAAHLLDAEADDLKGDLKALGGVDVVYDAVGGALGEQAFAALRPGGRYLVIGFASGDLPRFKPNHILVKNLSVTGLYWGAMAQLDPDSFRHSLTALMGMYADGQLRPHVSAIYPMDRVTEALARIRDRKVTGKVVIEVAQIA